MAMGGERPDDLMVCHLLGVRTLISLVLCVVLAILALSAPFCSWSHVLSQIFQDTKCLWGMSNMNSKVLCGPGIL